MKHCDRIWEEYDSLVLIKSKKEAIEILNLTEKLFYCGDNNE